MSAAFTPQRIGPLQLRNRLIKSATNEGMARGGHPSKLLLDHHQRIAAGGVAMTTVAYCAVSPDGRTFVDQLSMNPNSVPPLRRLTDAVHAQGAAACAQLTHGGAFNFLPSLSGWRALSSSGGFNPMGMISGRPLKKAMSVGDLERVADEFAQAAILAREAGFDAIEIHMGHGYLLSQFISPLYNKRRDHYGGSAVARARFPGTVLRRVLDAVGDTLAVSCKLSIVEGARGGAGIADSIEVARTLQAEGAHLLVLSAGMNVEAPWQIFGSNMPAELDQTFANPLVRLGAKMTRLRQPKTDFTPLYLRPHALHMRSALDMPLAYLGGAQSKAAIDEVLSDGFECVAMGRALIHDAEFPNKVRDGQLTESGCTACNQCVVSMYSPGGTHCVLTGEGDEKRNAKRLGRR